MDEKTAEKQAENLNFWPGSLPPQQVYFILNINPAFKPACPLKQEKNILKTLNLPLLEIDGIPGIFFTGDNLSV